MGERPTNPAAARLPGVRFVENGWSIKKMHRLIMLSKVYQESSAFQAAGSRRGPRQQVVMAYDRHRFEGETIRDSMLSVSGLLN